MHTLHNIKQRLWDELEDVSRKGDMDKNDLEFVHKVTDTIKNIDKIIMLEEEGGYSGRHRTSYGEREMWDGGNERRNGDNRQGSYANRRGGRGGYSRDGAKDEMIEELEESIKETDNPHIKEIMRNCVKILKEM